MRVPRPPALQCRQDRVDDPLNVPVDFVIAEPSHLIAPIVQELLSRPVATALILGRMSRAIDLDNKFLLAANEVGEIRTNRLLPNELKSAEKAVSKAPPKLALGLGLVLAEFARPARFD